MYLLLRNEPFAESFGVIDDKCALTNMFLAVLFLLLMEWSTFWMIDIYLSFKYLKITSAYMKYYYAISYPPAIFAFILCYFLYSGLFESPVCIYL